ncbi:MAG TPA: hypothetical protein VK737_08585 [Opitutales bacterium]|jgi:hypothetical protein|nr:hypothetical protein [Opitutales bacterium]
MKTKPYLGLAMAILFLLTGCGGKVDSTTVPDPVYAEVRIAKDKFQLLLEQGHGPVTVTQGGDKRNAYKVICSFIVQGDGPTYTIKQDMGSGAIAAGTITIDKIKNLVTIDLQVTTNGGSATQPYVNNGTYPLAFATFEPFYVSGNQS